MAPGLASNGFQAMPRFDRNKPAPTPEDEYVDAIVCEKMRVPSTLLDRDIGRKCAEGLAAQMHNATVNRAYEPIRWGNPAGLSVVEQQDDVNRRIDALEKQV